MHLEHGGSLSSVSCHQFWFVVQSTLPVAELLDRIWQMIDTQSESPSGNIAVELVRDHIVVADRTLD